MKRNYDHIVMISIDTLRADCLSPTPSKLWPGKYPGLKAPDTSFVDDLALRGTYFPHVVSTAPYTSASHGTYFTGRWPLNHGVHEFFNGKLRGDTLFTMARRQGYRTRFKVDFPIILGPHLGFDRDVEFIIEDDLAFIDAVELREPSLDFAHFGGVHVPYGFHNIKMGGKAYPDKIKEMESEIPAGYTMPVDQLVETYRTNEDLNLLLRYKRVVQYHYEAANYAKLFGLYLEGVEHFFRYRFQPFLERLLKVLEGRNYLLILFSDHGEEFDAESYGHHNSLSEGVLRVPVIFYGPDVPVALHCNRLRTVDVAPTLMECFLNDSVLREANLDGESMADVVWGEQEPVQRETFAQAYTNDTTEFVNHQQELLETGKSRRPLRHVRYKEAVYQGPYKITRQEFEYVGGGGIYNLQQCDARTALFMDPGDGHYVAIEAPPIETQLLSRLDWYNSILKASPQDREVPEDIQAQLRGMGYKV